MSDNNILNDAQRKELSEVYKKNKLPVCPTCRMKDNVIPVQDSSEPTDEGKVMRDSGKDMNIFL